MSSVTEIERALEQLSPEDLRVFRDWFVARYSADWDARFEQTAAAGRLDALGNAALKDLREGR